MQTINIEVPIPEDFQLIRKKELEELVDGQLIGRIWSMKDLEDYVGRSNDWLKENILYPHREELDAAHGGFVEYPKKQGQRWKFGALRLSKWLEENQQLIFGN